MFAKKKSFRKENFYEKIFSQKKNCAEKKISQKKKLCRKKNLPKKFFTKVRRKRNWPCTFKPTLWGGESNIQFKIQILSKLNTFDLSLVNFLLGSYGRSRLLTMTTYRENINRSVISIIFNVLTIYVYQRKKMIQDVSLTRSYWNGRDFVG